VPLRFRNVTLAKTHSSLLKNPSLILVIWELGPQSHHRSRCFISKVREVNVHRRVRVRDIQPVSTTNVFIRIDIPMDGIADADERRPVLDGSIDTEILTGSSVAQGPVTTIDLIECPLV
jgi:hypothetical protein